MNRILAVARREYMEHVRTRSFMVGIVLLPVIVFASIAIPKLLDRVSGVNEVVMVDAGSGLGEAVAEAYGESETHPLDTVTLSPEDVEAYVNGRMEDLESGDLEAILVLETDVVTAGQVRWYSANLAREEPRESLLRAVNHEVRGERFAREGIRPEVISSITASVTTRDFDVSQQGKEVDTKASKAKGFIPMIFVYLMFIGIMGQSQTMLTSTVEEKSNRVIEVLLSSVSPFQLLAGKMIGLGGVSFTLFSVWMAGGFIMIKRNGWEQFVEPSTLLYFLAFFVPGFLLYAAIMAALGSLSNDLKEAQNLMTPVMMILILPLLTMFWVGQNPDHLVSRIMSFLPNFTPFLMINRLASAQPPGTMEVILSLLVLIGGILFTVWLAARVFRVGVLLYGKQPSFREVGRWIRESRD
jgi:ABC-2 type transport system permease protein